MPGQRWHVDLRKDVQGAKLARLITGIADVWERYDLLVAVEQLEAYGPEPDEVEEVLNARYELFRRRFHEVAALVAVHDSWTRQITVIAIWRPGIKIDVYVEACTALGLANPARERRAAS